MEITDFQIEFDTYSRSFKSILFFGKMEYLENEKGKNIGFNNGNFFVDSYFGIGLCTL